MTESRPLRRPAFESKDTLDAPQLTGSLSSLQANSGLTLDLNPNGHTAHPAEGRIGTRDFGSRSKSEPAPLVEVDSDDTIEDYDDLEIDPDTLVANSRQSMNENMRPNVGLGRNGPSTWRFDTDVNDKDRRKSIQIRLEKTDRKGRYTLTADDPEIRDILRRGLEREEIEAGNKKRRIRFRDLVFTRQFTTFDRQNPTSSESPFFGFFTLFWLAMVLIFFQVAMHNWRDYGSILGNQQIVRMMFSRDVFLLGATDAVLCASTTLTFFLQKLVQKGYINWARSGWIVQNIWQSTFLGTLVWWTWFRDWPWSHTIFIVLHTLIFLMKQHSFAFYNGYLSGVFRRRALLQRKLKQLEVIDPVHSPPTSPGVLPPSHHSASIDLGKLSQKSDDGLKKRRPSMGPRTGTDFTLEKSDVASVASAIESGRPLDQDQFHAFEDVIKSEISDLTRELQGKITPNPQGTSVYPNNLCLSNFADFICLPTLVYELEYPRQERINWWYVAEKTTATFGVLGVMMVISQAFIYPPVARTVAMKEAGMPIEERWKEFPFVVSDMLFPLLLEQLLSWYVIWECILNVLAELTRFADRGFYGDWWNSVSWDQYARDWNRPVHNFLLRHVYHSSISTFHLSRNAATFFTFLLSALVHELIMAVLFKKVRGYLFTMQLLQMPLVTLSRSKLLKGRTVLGNVIFWLGLFVGPSFLTSLYLIL